MATLDDFMAFNFMEDERETQQTTEYLHFETSQKYQKQFWEDDESSNNERSSYWDDDKSSTEDDY